jgi:hypothetical protein
MIPITATPTAQASLSADGRVRADWLRFGELADAAAQDTDNALGSRLIVDHRAALDDLVAAGRIEPAVADLVQEAYAAAVYHVWRSNAPITCYEPVQVDYAPAGAGTLVAQAGALEQIAAQGEVDADTLATIQSALERDMAFYALTDEEVEAMYRRLIDESQANGQPVPAFDQIELEITPDAKAAAQFIVDLLTGK